MTDYLPTYYDPLGTENVTAAICRELERQPLIPLDPPIGSFDGSGLYAIYYDGETVRLYTPLRGYKIPVYVGRAHSHNSATGATIARRNPLWGRVGIHRRSIEESPLPIGEFGVRLLRLPDVHIDLGENGLRTTYQPVWNTILTGFGSKEQGPTTRQSARTKWDTVHPGRSRTYGAKKHNKAELERAVRDHVAQQLASYDAVPWHQG